MISTQLYHFKEVVNLSLISTTSITSFIKVMEILCARRVQIAQYHLEDKNTV